jgi:hypothetical protein
MRCATSISDASPLVGLAPIERLPGDVVGRIASHLGVRDRFVLTRLVSRAVTRLATHGAGAAWSTVDLSPHAKSVTDAVLAGGRIPLAWTESLNLWGCSHLSPQAVCGALAAVADGHGSRARLLEWQHNRQHERRNQRKQSPHRHTDVHHGGGGGGGGGSSSSDGRAADRRLHNGFPPPPSVALNAHTLVSAGLLRLDLGRTAANHAVVEAVVRTAPQLQSIGLWNCDAIGDAEVAALGALRNLEEMDLGHCSSVTDAGLRAFASERAASRKGLHRRGLAKLVLTWCFRITDAGVLAALECPGTDRMVEDKDDGDDDDDDGDGGDGDSADSAGSSGGDGAHLSSAHPLPRRPALELDLGGCHHVTDDAVDSITARYRLVRFGAHSCTRLTDATLVHLARRCARSLLAADLTLCRGVTGFGVHELTSRCARLESLSLEGCHEVRSGSIAAGTTRNLRQLSLAFCSQLSEASVIDVVRSSPLLETLDLRWVSDAGRAVLAALAAACPRFRKLDARWCDRLSDEDIAVARRTFEVSHARAQGNPSVA